MFLSLCLSLFSLSFEAASRPPFAICQMSFIVVLQSEFIGGQYSNQGTQLKKDKYPLKKKTKNKTKQTTNSKM